MSPEFALALVRGSLRAILMRVLGRCPDGVRGVCRKLPETVLTAESYRRLILLLDDKPTARLLFQVDELEDALINLLHDVPPSIRRPVLLVSKNWLTQLAGLPEGLRFLASRGAAPSFDALVNELATCRQLSQFVAKIAEMAGALPIAEASPLPLIGRARRLDNINEIRSLAKAWHNCLAGYIRPTRRGECVVYLWESNSVSAACLVQNHGRFGWFLSDVNGPRNAKLEPADFAVIAQTFDEHGVPQSAVVDAIESIVDAASKPDDVRQLVRAVRRRRNR